MTAGLKAFHKLRRGTLQRHFQRFLFLRNFWNLCLRKGANKAQMLLGILASRHALSNIGIGMVFVTFQLFEQLLISTLFSSKLVSDGYRKFSPQETTKTNCMFAFHFFLFSYYFRLLLKLEFMISKMASSQWQVLQIPPGISLSFLTSLSTSLLPLSSFPLSSSLYLLSSPLPFSSPSPP